MVNEAVEVKVTREAGLDSAIRIWKKGTRSLLAEFKRRRRFRTKREKENYKRKKSLIRRRRLADRI